MIIRTEHRKAAETGRIVRKGSSGYFRFATPQAIYKWQQGALPTIANLVVLAAVLQVRMDDILITDTAAQIQISA